MCPSGGWESHGQKLHCHFRSVIKWEMARKLIHHVIWESQNTNTDNENNQVNNIWNTEQVYFYRSSSINRFFGKIYIFASQAFVKFPYLYSLFISEWIKYECIMKAVSLLLLLDEKKKIFPDRILHFQCIDNINMDSHFLSFSVHCSRRNGVCMCVSLSIEKEILAFSFAFCRKRWISFDEIINLPLKW